MAILWFFWCTTLAVTGTLFVMFLMIGLGRLDRFAALRVVYLNRRFAPKPGERRASFTMIERLVAALLSMYFGSMIFRQIVAAIG